MIHPILEYCSSIWSPHTKFNVSKLEHVQRQSARFVYHDFSQGESSTISLTHAKHHPSSPLQHKYQIHMQAYIFQPPQSGNECNTTYRNVYMILQ